MFGYIVSVRNSKIFVSNSSDPQEIYEKDLKKNVANGTEILDDEAFAKILGELIIEKFGPNPEKQPLNFLTEPQDVFVAFITSDKDSGNDEDYLLAQAEKKVASRGLTLDDVYFSYQKIAPFTYQFIAIVKPFLESYLEIAADLEFEVDSVVPWFLLLPRIKKNISEARTFVVDGGDGGLAIHTEFGGVKQVEKINKDDLDKLVDDEKIVWDENKHELFASVFIDDMVSSKINLLNLLPLPVEQNKPTALVYVGSAVTAAVLIGGVYFGINYANSVNKSEVLSESREESQIIQIVESDKTEETNIEESSTEDQEDVTEEFAKREYLRVKVENSTQQGGLAGNTSSYLSGLGYDTVAPSDYDGEALDSTLIRLDPNFENYEDVLLEDLSDKFTQIEVTFDLEEDLDYNALIIAGNDGE